MSQTSDPSSNTLPRPELNPLLNPLLAENMTRWAEVYFNNPPERREQAVLELLRELEAQRALREAATGVPRAAFSTPAPVPVARPAYEPELVRCERCGRDNPIGHKFCGMCGETLHAGRVADRHLSSLYSEPDRGAMAQEQDRTEAELASERNLDSNDERYVQPASNWNGLSLFQSGPPEQEAYEDYDDAEPVYESPRSHPYRIYVGGLLAIALLALGYTAWHASQNSQASDEPSSPPPIAAKDTPPAAVPSATTSNKAKETAPPPSAPPAEKPAPVATKAPAPATTHDNVDEVNPRTHAASDKASIGAPRQPSAGGGTEELAQAQRYLSGTNGRRDSATAAQLLWKSIAKHNDQATLLMADLYLKGDGVPKNCDQARVLLYAAARKGVSGAGERLRNMQAFGCQ